MTINPDGRRYSDGDYALPCFASSPVSRSRPKAAVAIANAAFTPGPWRVEDGTTLVWGACNAEDGSNYGMGYPVTQARVRLGSATEHMSEFREDEGEANARLIAAAPILYEAAKKHLEWIQKENDGPQYGKLTRDTHPLGEAIWRQWWDEQLELCAETEALCRAGLASADTRRNGEDAVKLAAEFTSGAVPEGQTPTP